MTTEIWACDPFITHSLFNILNAIPLAVLAADRQ
jgi:hypothetical protein